MKMSDVYLAVWSGDNNALSPSYSRRDISCRMDKLRTDKLCNYEEITFAITFLNSNTVVLNEIRSMDSTVDLCFSFLLPLLLTFYCSHILLCQIEFSGYCSNVDFH